ncbi:hypothetical protein A3I51_05155 [Candidatus Gottesmanbacteria bacterium RIFCSPLOWO2_02_FULL_38_8]|nr:MAG: hypothetical protein A3I51_05155 [Candidatus Gottesmanbacteria bacterium RIFCSPLOWO2_02_FULL_38_8]
MFNSKKKFHGWIIRGKRYSAFIGNLLAMRQPAHIVSKPVRKNRKYLERVVYVGCIHGGNEDIYEKLENLTKNPPDYLIFSGDITGTAEIEKLKKYFYDEKERKNNSIFDKFEYFGNWAATLAKEKRQKLLNRLHKSAEKLLRVIKKIKKSGTKIYLIEGNWDNPKTSGIKVIMGEDITDIIDVPGFFKSHGFNFIRNMMTVSTKTTFHILLPFNTLLHFDDITKKEIESVQEKIAKARKNGKVIIMVGHAEANWRVHHLQQKNSRVLGERGLVIRNFSRAMALFCPDEVIYPHQHAQIRDEKGNLIDLNAKYILQVRHDGVRLIDEPDKLNLDRKNIVTTYIPFGFLAE